ncbi:MAG: DUF2182 domain-containing protein [Pseudomonadota bacterium]
MQSIAARQRMLILAVLVPASLLAWVVMALGSTGGARSDVLLICSADFIWSVPSWDKLAFVLAFASPLMIAFGWAAMIVAMMLPTVIDQLAHISQRSFKRTGSWCLMLFVGGYCAIWMVAGLILIAAALIIRLSMSDAMAPACLAAMVGLTWQLSPWKQAALNQCHRRSSLAAFPPDVYRDAIVAGIQHGFWCCVSCWALMLLALLLPWHGTLTTFIVAIFIWAERLEPAREPAWRLRSPKRACRMGAWHVAGVAKFLLCRGGELAE